MMKGEVRRKSEIKRITEKNIYSRNEEGENKIKR